MKKTFYFFYLEVALRRDNKPYVYAFNNVSHVPTGKLVEIFKIDLAKDPHVLKGYLLKKSYYKRHKKFIDQHIGTIDLDVFEYCLRHYVSDDFNEIRKLYKESLME
jgi:hypothetical protein